MIPDIAAALAARLGEWLMPKGSQLPGKTCLSHRHLMGYILLSMTCQPHRVRWTLVCAAAFIQVYTRLTLWPQPAQAVPMLWPWQTAWLNCSKRGRRLKAGVLHAG